MSMITFDECHPIPIADHTIKLRRLRNENGRAVILFHGGNTSGDTFLYPRDGLAGYLARSGWDVWVADWRGSPSVLRADAIRFTVDDVANDDLPEAIEFVRRKSECQHLAVVAHCLSGCALSMAIARGHLQPKERKVDRVVLTTLGLFFESCWDGWIKAEDFILERLEADPSRIINVDPKAPAGWPRPLQEALDRWPRAWLPPWVALAADPLETLTFMFGRPYWRRALHPELWARWIIRCIQALLDRDAYNRLGAMFGPMHLGMYLHIGQMVRRGYAAPFNQLDVIDRPRITNARQRHVSSAAPDDLNPTPFLDHHITLIGSTDNQLWHRDSIDLMYEWLCSNAGSRRHQFRKVIVPGGHQDLYWGRDAQSVYRHILDAIGS
jgi:hypothetical protein